VAVGPVALFDFLIDKIKIDHASYLSQWMVRTNSLLEADIHMEVSGEQRNELQTRYTIHRKGPIWATACPGLTERRDKPA
jgi:hypothetical protein